MREILLYDPKRVPPEWTALIEPGQYAAFLGDVLSSAPMSTDGSPVSSASKHSCLLFESLPEAETFCRETVQKFKRMKCEVFDSTGRVNAPVAVIVNPEFEHTLDTEARGHRLMRWGIVAIALSLPLFGYAWKSHEVWWPILFGINLVFAGLRLLHWGSGLKEEISYRQKQAELRRQQNAARTEKERE